jgi:L-lactate dehydrogenase (cytochrome)
MGERFMNEALPERAAEAAKRITPNPAGRLNRVHDLEELEDVIRPRLPRAVFGYVAHGSETETTLHSNRQQFDDWRLLTRVLVGVKRRSLQRVLFGRSYAGPFGIAPMGGSALVAFDGHLVMARAAYKSGIPFILSANSIIPMEEVAAANPDLWFAAYQSPTPQAVTGMVERVAAAGISTLVLTADVPVGSNRENDARAGFSFPIRPSLRLSWDVLTHPRWMFGVLARTLLKRGIPHIVNLEPDGGPGLFSRSVKGIAAHEDLNWDHFKLMRRLWKGPLIVKGVLSPRDVAAARANGADGVIVSNHGGRQLDHAVSPLRILPSLVECADGMAVMVDSGFRRGTDVIKAYGLGADFVFVGRPFLYSAVLGGEAGVLRAIELLSKEIDKDLALLGLHDMAEVGADALFRNTPVSC